MRCKIQVADNGTRQTNVKVFQIVLQLQQIVTRIPGQVERQQPVYLLDALGKTSPFHLEFVRSAEVIGMAIFISEFLLIFSSQALVAVLKVNFMKHGNGAKKIERREFAIEDSVTKRDIDLKTKWDVCFFPGQRVEMSMIFRQTNLSYGLAEHTCPRCICPHPNPEEGRDHNLDW